MPRPSEFGVAKHGYVARRSGWFSDRTECYLAAGRPALVQDTGTGPILRETIGAGYEEPRDRRVLIDAPVGCC